jgi:nucleotide-binding universal stress UspA family protein
MAAADAGTVILVAAIDGADELLAEGVRTGWLDLGGNLSEADLEEAEREQYRLATEHLEELRSDLAARGVLTVEEHAVTGSAAQAIVEAASTFDCDLVVMATHGRSGLGRTLLGSVADHVVRRAGCPVLLVRPS